VRWPSIQWELGRAYAAAPPAERATLDAVFAGLNSYLGNFIGEFVGELALNLFFLLIACGMLRSLHRPRWLGVGGMIASLVGFVAMFRNVTPAVARVADVNNLVLPLWLGILGVAFIRERARE
jgi:hypothetical protein